MEKPDNTSAQPLHADLIPLGIEQVRIARRLIGKVERDGEQNERSDPRSDEGIPSSLFGHLLPGNHDDIIDMK